MKKTTLLILLALPLLFDCSKSASLPGNAAIQVSGQYTEYIITQQDVGAFCLNNPKCHPDRTGDITIDGYNQLQIREMYWIKNTIIYAPKTREVLDGNVVIGYLDWSEQNARFVPVEKSKGVKK